MKKPDNKTTLSKHKFGSYRMCTNVKVSHLLQVMNLYTSRDGRSSNMQNVTQRLGDVIQRMHNCTKWILAESWVTVDSDGNCRLFYVSMKSRPFISFY